MWVIPLGMGSRGEWRGVVSAGSCCWFTWEGTTNAVDTSGLPSDHTDCLYNDPPPTSCEKQQSCQQPHHCWSQWEKETFSTATYSNSLCIKGLRWEIPWLEEPGGLQSMGLRRVWHDWTTSLSLFSFMHWRRKWQPTPVFLPGECQGRGSLVGCHLWGRTELETTEAT